MAVLTLTSSLSRQSGAVSVSSKSTSSMHMKRRSSFDNQPTKEQWNCKHRQKICSGTDSDRSQTTKTTTTTMSSITHYSAGLEINSNNETHNKENSQQQERGGVRRATINFITYACRAYRPTTSLTNNNCATMNFKTKSDFILAEHVLGRLLSKIMILLLFNVL